MKKSVLALSVVSALIMASPVAFAGKKADKKGGASCEHCKKEKCEHCGKDHKDCKCDGHGKKEGAEGAAHGTGDGHSH